MQVVNDEVETDDDKFSKISTIDENEYAETNGASEDEFHGKSLPSGKPINQPDEANEPHDLTSNLNSVVPDLRVQPKGNKSTDPNGSC